MQLATLRVLPPGTPNINDLPKRRIFHLPNERYQATLRAFLIAEAQQEAREQIADSCDTLSGIADRIDALERQATLGMLLVGSLTALVNPLLGLGIAAKSFLPGVASLISDHTLRPLGGFWQRQRRSRAEREAERSVLRSFASAEVTTRVDPLLRRLDHAIRTPETEHDPLFDADLVDRDDPWRAHCIRAIADVYGDHVDRGCPDPVIGLGPEDIRWLRVLFAELPDNTTN